MPETPRPTATRGRVRRAGWVRVTHGVHQPEGADPLVAWQLVLPPSGRFTHLTAAGLYGWWLPPLPADLPVMAAVRRDETRPEREGLAVCRHRELAEPAVLGTVRVDPPEEVLLACARDVGLLDLVVLVDSALRLGCSREVVAKAAGRRRRGAPALRHALALCDPRSESAWETLLRLLHVWCEVEVEPQWVLLDGSGGFVARADLWLVGTDSIHEYDGAHHLERHQQGLDLRRVRRINDQGVIRRGYTSEDVLNHAVSILRDADLALGRAHDPARIRRWHAELARSAFTPRGRHLLRLRLGVTST